MSAFAQRQTSLRGFTIIELLTVTAIISVLVSILLPAIQTAREAARKMQCQSNLKQMGLALHNYHDVHNIFPPSCIVDPYAEGTSYGISFGDVVRVGPPGYGWGLCLLPFVEQESLYRTFSFTDPVWAPRNAKPASTRVALFLCPSATGGSDGFEIQKEGVDNRHGESLRRDDGSTIVFSHSHYVTNAGINQPWGRATEYCYNFDIPEPVSGSPKPAVIDGPFYPNSHTAARDVIDGLSNTIFIGERSSFLSNNTWVGVVPQAVVVPRLDIRPWLSENNAATDLVGCHSGPDVHDHPQVIIHAPNNPFGHTDEMWGEHGSGCNVLMGDGSVRYYSAFVDGNLWASISTRNGGEITGDF